MAQARKQSAIDRARTRLEGLTNAIGGDRACNVCGATFRRFIPYRGGSSAEPDFYKKLHLVGSDVDNFECQYCESHDRERHLFMFFDTLKLWPRMRNSRILHLAPERHLSTKIAEQGPSEYVKGDLNPSRPDIQKLNATDIRFPDGTFDVLIANHLLEHIPDYRKALSEFYRVLSPGGIAILQTPYSKMLVHNFEDEGLNTEELRCWFFGQEDHVRVFSERVFLQSLVDTGFGLDLKKHGDYFDATTTRRYGVPGNEDLILVTK